MMTVSIWTPLQAAPISQAAPDLRGYVEQPGGRPDACAGSGPWKKGSTACDGRVLTVGMPVLYSPKRREKDHGARQKIARVLRRDLGRDLPFRAPGCGADAAARIHLEGNRSGGLCRDRRR